MVRDRWDLNSTQLLTPPDFRRVVVWLKVDQNTRQGAALRLHKLREVSIYSHLCIHHVIAFVLAMRASCNRSTLRICLDPPEVLQMTKYRLITATAPRLKLYRARNWCRWPARMVWAVAILWPWTRSWCRTTWRPKCVRRAR